MKKRTAFIGAILSLIPLGQPLILKTGVVLSTTGLMFATSKNIYAGDNSYYFNRAYDKAERGDFYGAIFDYTKAIEIDPNDADAYYNRGISKSDLKDYYGAISDYEKAIEINPQYVEAYNNISFLKRKKEINDNYGAIFYATQAININPNHSNSYLNRGVAKENIGDLIGACEDWRKASSLGNKDTPSWVRDQC